MRAFVFTDSSLTRHAGRFVWLAIDTEKKQNAAVRKRLGINAIPTFFVLDPVTEKVALRWVGGFNVAQLDRLLDDGALAVSGGRDASALDAAVVKADALYGEARYGDAVVAYRDALAQATPEWPRYGRAVEAMLFSLQQTQGWTEAVTLAHQTVPRLRGTPFGANAASYGLGAALQLPKEHPDRAARITGFETEVRAALADSTIALSGDDRSGLYTVLLDSRQQAEDEPGAARVAAEWSAFLDGEAARARNPQERMVYDSHRLSAYLETGHPERALPMLEASERDAPGDYNPPARLAITYRALKEWDKGLAASSRAMARAYGPRKLGFFPVRADLQLGRADTTAAIRTLEWALAYADSLPDGQRSSATVASLQKKLDALRPRP